MRVFCQQTALFVIPSMVLLGWVLDKPLALLFDPFESVVLYISGQSSHRFWATCRIIDGWLEVHTMGYVVADGKSNWLEGVILVCLLFYPFSSFSLSG